MAAQRVRFTLLHADGESEFNFEVHQFTGHTDSIGAKDANLQLSEQRAHAVVKFLSQRGVAAARIEAAGYGDTRPIAPNDTETNRAKNRRIEFRVLTQ
jgi:outer membrane protein OmpA-like peptidoglycan-associated protein